MVNAAQKPVLEPVDLLFEVLVEVIDGHAVGATATAVVPHAFAGGIERPALDELIEHAPHRSL